MKMSSRIIRSNPIRISLILLMIAIDNLLEKIAEEEGGEGAIETGSLGADLEIIFKKIETLEDKYEQE